jgi:lysophospholipase L1-like esterase
MKFICLERYVLALLLIATWSLQSSAQHVVSEPAVEFRSYAYETKPDDEAFRKFNPRKAPQPGELILKPGDRLAICGDSITEQKMYSRIIETYLTVCVPQLEITARQYGWSGEKTDGFLKRMDNDCLRFNPTIATLCYGMNDSRYRPFDVTNGMWYEDHYRAIVRKFKDADVRVVLGSPGCAGKTASWVDSRSGSLDEHNENLCALRDIAIDVAESEQVAFADVFWPMYQAHVFGPGQHHATKKKPYHVAGKDGIHPGWAGQVVMAYAFLRAMGLDGSLAEFNIDLERNAATASEGHDIEPVGAGKFSINSTRYPFCAKGDLNSDDSVRSGMTLVPFAEDLNRFRLKATGIKNGKYKLAKGINLAEVFPDNPFSEAFERVEKAVFEKQKYETEQVKGIFHGAEGKADFEKAVADTEAKRQPLADAIRAAFVPVKHEIAVEAVP